MHDKPCPSVHNHCMTYPGLDQRFIHCTAHLWEPLLSRKKWAAFFPFQVSDFLSWSLDLHLCISHLCSKYSVFCIVWLPSEPLCSFYPYNVMQPWAPQAVRYPNNHFVYYRPHFWLQHLASMVLSETVGKIIFLSPIYCWPIQPASPACFGVVQPWSFWYGTFPITCSLEGNCMQCSRPRMLYIAWWCNSDFLHSWCRFSPVEHGSNQSMPSNVSTRLHGHDFAA